MKKIIKIFALVLFIMVGMASLSSCRAEDIVQHNLLRDTGNFKTYRKITVINLRSGEILMEFEGYLTSKLDNEGDVNIIIRVAEGEYQLHYVRLADEVTYLSEQLDTTPSSPYYYKVTIYAPYPRFDYPQE